MKIKEVEKRCGLSSKTIRFYEDKGLLNVQRSANSYREYTEDTILQLKKIKLLRKLGIPIADILAWQKEEYTLQELLFQQLIELEKNHHHTEITKNICQDILKKEELLQQPDHILETVDFIHTKEFHTFLKDVHLLSQPSLFTQLLFSLIFLGPILFLFINIADNNQDKLLLNALVALVAAGILAISWFAYAQHRKEHKEVKKGTGLAILGLVGCVALGLGFVVGIGALQEFLFVNDEYLMFTSPRVFQVLPFFFMVEVIVFAFAFIYRKKKNKDFQDFVFFQNFILRHKWIFLVINIVIFYLCLCNIAVVYPERIEVRRFYQPFAHSYSLQDIDHVETGFFDQHFNLLQEHKGDFYYTIHFTDGTSIAISQPTPAKKQKYTDHTYLEIEEYDAYLMKHNIRKKSSEKNYNANVLGQEYRERFLNIVRNK